MMKIDSRNKKTMEQITLSELPSELQHWFNQVQKTGKPITVIHNGMPVAMIYLAQSSKRAPFGIAKESGQVLRDLVEPPLSPTTWNVLQ